MDDIKLPIDCLDLPENAAENLRCRLGLAPTDELRISYCTGPGDVAGTYERWLGGQTDDRVPTFAYSTMFYELVTRLGARGQILSEADPPSISSVPFQFAKLPASDSSGRIKYRLSLFHRIRAAVAAVDTFQPHLIIASSYLTAAAWPALSRRAPVIPSIHGAFWPMERPLVGVRGNFRYQSLRRQAVFARAAVCTSAECARQISALTNGRIAGRIECPQIPNRYTVKSRHAAKQLLFVGRIEESKGIFLLLDAFSELIQHHPDICLSFAGSGSADAALKKRVDALQTSRIKLLGHLSGHDVHEAISKSDLLICPTLKALTEGLAVVGFEAAAHGVPSVLSSNVPAKDLLASCAKLFSADDKEALRNCLEGLISSEAEYAALVHGTAVVRDMIYDRSRSWGSQLYLAMLDATSVTL